MENNFKERVNGLGAFGNLTGSLNACFLYGLVALSVFALAVQTPFHSDDFAYSLMGFDLDRHIKHYQEWSGRVLADFISPLLLSFDNYIVKAGVSTGAVCLYFYTLATLPPREVFSGSVKPSVIFFLLFLAYWAGNSALGQTTFWIVGSANYLWTYIFVVLFLKFFFRFLFKSSWLRAALLGILAFLAGCTNENTVVFLPVLCFFMMHHVHKIGRPIPASAWGIILLLCLGIAVLLLAPGNAARVLVEGGIWYDLSISTRVKIHFFRRFLPALGRSYPVFIFLGLLFWFLFKNNAFKLKNVFFPLIFIACGILSFAFMFAAPVFVARARSGGLMFFLCALAWLIPVFCHSVVQWKKILAVIMLPFFLFFAASYFCMYVSYANAMVQDQVRTDLIRQAKQDMVTHLSIPLFYNGFLLRGGDKLSQYHSPSMAKFHGVQQIDGFALPFDYSLLKNGLRCAVTHLLLETDSAGWSISNVFVKKDFWRNQSLVMVELLSEAGKGEFSEEQHIDLQCFSREKKKMAAVNNFENRLYRLGSKYYAVQKIKGKPDELAVLVLRVGDQKAREAAVTLLLQD